MFVAPSEQLQVKILKKQLFGIDFTFLFPRRDNLLQEAIKKLINGRVHLLPPVMWVRSRLNSPVCIGIEAGRERLALVCYRPLSTPSTV